MKWFRTKEPGDLYKPTRRGFPTVPSMPTRRTAALCIAALLLTCRLPAQAVAPAVTWVGNSFSGASNRWVQNFFIHTRVQPDGTVTSGGDYLFRGRI